ncbi:methylaspartate ammonia-lyase N-terminal domain protein, partial [Bordetella bronchiseptica MBORD681]|uniref:IclR family transcriptional regulator domain-containing protein n=1 Tax=Bordetella bronchiseptica TaxID=518 RepID=UPI0004A11B4A
DGIGGYYWRDQEAIGQGAPRDGFLYRGAPVTPGFTSIIQKEPLSPTGLAALPARELNRDLKQIREQGYSVSTRGEKIEGAAGISTPIFGTGGHVIGCFSLFIPRIRYPEHRETELAQLLVREAGALSDVLAGRQAAPAGAPGAAR